MRQEVVTTARGYKKNGIPTALGLTCKSRSATESPSTLDIAWAAGIYEGEGYCSFTSRHKDCVEAAVTQKDRWLVDRFSDLFGGKVSAEKSRGSHGNDPLGGEYYRWRLYGARARGFLMTIYKFLSPRRQEQVRRLEFMGGLKWQDQK